MAETTLRDELIAVVREGRQAEHDLIATLSDTARTLQGTIDAWSVKDVVAHLGVNRQQLADAFTAGRTGQNLAQESNYLEENDQNFTRFQYASWEEVNTFADETVNALIAELEQYNDEQVRQPHLQAWMPEHATIVNGILGTCINHPYQHLSLVYFENGNPDAAVSTLERVLSLYHTYDPSPRTLSIAEYEVASCYVHIGRNDRAIPLIRRAFEHRPALQEQAKTDSDWDTLREQPDFQALFTR